MAAARAPGAGPADDLVVIGLGQLAERRGRLGVLVELALEAPRNRRQRPVAVDPGRHRRDRLAELAREAAAALARDRVAGMRSGPDVVARRTAPRLRARGRRQARRRASRARRAAAARRATRTTCPPALATSAPRGSPAVIGDHAGAALDCGTRRRQGLGGRAAVRDRDHQMTAGDPARQRGRAVDRRRRAQDIAPQRLGQAAADRRPAERARSSPRPAARRPRRPAPPRRRRARRAAARRAAPPDRTSPRTGSSASLREYPLAFGHPRSRGNRRRRGRPRRRRRLGAGADRRARPDDRRSDECALAHARPLLHDRPVELRALLDGCTGRDRAARARRRAPAPTTAPAAT